MLAGYFLLKERITRPRLAGFALLIAGMLLTIV